MTDQSLDKYIDDLCDVFVKVQSREDCKALLDDLCTYKEIEQMALRLHAADMFIKGKKYTEITAETELSSATISRVSRCVTHGSGGYMKLLSEKGE